MCAGNAGGVAEPGLVVLIGDLQAFELLLERVLAQAVVVEPQVHGLGFRRVEPRRQ